jgi:hypothetical protein
LTSASIPPSAPDVVVAIVTEAHLEGRALGNGRNGRDNGDRDLRRLAEAAEP